MLPVILVTGASSGIGRAIAKAFAKKGCRLVINSRSSKKALEETCADIRALGCDCISLLGDVSDPAFCETLCSLALSRFGRIDCLVNNAGISHVGLFQEMSVEEIDRLLRVDLGSALWMSRAAVSSMIRSGSGCILNISSVWGNVGASCEAVYSAAKGGINSFTKALAKELAPSGIRINAIACGAIDTPMNEWMDEEEKEMLLNEIPAGRMGRPEEVGSLAVSLFESTPYLTGQIITLDGGWQ